MSAEQTTTPQMAATAVREKTANIARGETAPQKAARPAAQQAEAAAAPSGNGRAPRIETALGAFNPALFEPYGAAGENWARGMAEISTEVAQFAGRRLEASFEAGEALTRCREWHDVVRWQQDWTERSMGAYLEETKRLSDLASKLMTDTWRPIASAGEDRD